MKYYYERKVISKETLYLGPWYFSSPFAMFLRRVCVKILGWLERVTWGRWEVAGRLDSLQFKPREACQPCHLPPNHEVYKPWTLTTAPAPSIQWPQATGMIPTAFPRVCKYLVLAQTQLSLEFYSSSVCRYLPQLRMISPKSLPNGILCHFCKFCISFVVVRM